jgi:hypothetical protein
VGQRNFQEGKRRQAGKEEGGRTSPKCNFPRLVLKEALKKFEEKGSR